MVSVKVPFRQRLLLACILICLFCVETHAGERPKRLVVAEVVDETGNEKWRNHLIALGIADLLATELYDTGRYMPVEANSEILEMLRDFLKERWIHSQSENMPEKPLADEQIYEKTGCDAIASAVVKKFSTRRISSIGLLAASKTTIEVELELTLKEKSGQVMSARGKGAAETRALGVLFQIRNDKIYFDETTVGQATKKAVQDAVAKLF